MTCQASNTGSKLDALMRVPAVCKYHVEAYCRLPPSMPPALPRRASQAISVATSAAFQQAKAYDQLSAHQHPPAQPWSGRQTAAMLFTLSIMAFACLVLLCEMHPRTHSLSVMHHDRRLPADNRASNFSPLGIQIPARRIPSRPYSCSLQRLRASRHL